MLPVCVEFCQLPFGKRQRHDGYKGLSCPFVGSRDTQFQLPHITPGDVRQRRQSSDLDEQPISEPALFESHGVQVTYRNGDLVYAGLNHSKKSVLNLIFEGQSRCRCCNESAARRQPPDDETDALQGCFPRGPDHVY